MLLFVEAQQNFKQCDPVRDSSNVGPTEVSQSKKILMC